MTPKACYGLTVPPLSVVSGEPSGEVSGEPDASGLSAGVSVGRSVGFVVGVAVGAAVGVAVGAVVGLTSLLLFLHPVRISVNESIAARIIGIRRFIIQITSVIHAESSAYSL